MATSRNKVPSTLQVKQRKLYQALGYVTAFPGWLICLESLIKNAEENSRVDSTNLLAITTNLRKELRALEDQLRTSMKELSRNE